MEATPTPTREKQIEVLSRTAAVTFVLARAFNLWNKKLEAESRRLRMTHTHETKQALRFIEDGCKKASIGARHFEDWALEAGQTESGHCGDEQAYNSYLTDGAWLAYLAGATFNAAHEDDTIRLQIETLCKNKTKETPLISWEYLQELRPTL